MNKTTDIRMEAWGLARAQSQAECYRLLERGDAVAVRVFAALARDEWGVRAAFADGARGVNIDLTDPRTGVTTRLTGTRRPMPPVRRAPAANGGTI